MIYIDDDHDDDHNDEDDDNNNIYKSYNNCSVSPVHWFNLLQNVA